MTARPPSKPPRRRKRRWTRSTHLSVSKQIAVGGVRYHASLNALAQRCAELEPLHDTSARHLELFDDGATAEQAIAPAEMQAVTLYARRSRLLPVSGATQCEPLALGYMSHDQVTATPVLIAVADWTALAELISSRQGAGDGCRFDLRSMRVRFRPGPGSLDRLMGKPSHK